MKTSKYKFIMYWKYAFVLELQDGTRIVNEEQNSGDIYRMDINAEGTVTWDETENCWTIDRDKFQTIN
jgi:hypothetical protein